MIGTAYVEIIKLGLPEIALVITALAVLAVDALVARGEPLRLRMGLGVGVASVGCVAAGALLIILNGNGVIGDDLFVVTPLISLVKVAILAITIPALIVSAYGKFTDHAGEYVALVLFAVLGMMFLVSAENLLMVFVALEMTSLSLYILTAFNKRNVKSAEAALKYFLFGGMAAAMALFGFSLLYGVTGTTNLNLIGPALSAHATDPLVLVALVGVVAGLGFKVAVVPFHLWAPDAYEGAPTPSAALIATGSKIASFFILAKLVMVGFSGARGSADWGHLASGWIMALGILAAISMVFGNVAALAQSSVKRLLSYSAIAHAGYMLLGIMADSGQGMSALLFYVIVYGLATMGAFAVISVVEEQRGGDRFSDLAGMSKTAPVLSLCLLIFLLSLAGIPPLAGFFGKFYVFVAAANAGQQELGMLWLIILGIATSVVSLYYYLMVLKQVYVKEASAEAGTISQPLAATAVVVVLCLVVILLGCFPDRLLALIECASSGAH